MTDQTKDNISMLHTSNKAKEHERRKVQDELDDAMELVLYNKDTVDNHIRFTQYVDASSLDHFLYRDFPDEV